MTAVCLAFDTALPHCDVALLEGGTVVGHAREAMDRGQSERLMPLVLGVLAAADMELAALDAIAVGTGPGNFTGLRIAISTARGLRLGLGVPAVGVSLFDVMRAPYSATVATELISLPGPRGAAYACAYREGVPVGAPDLIDPADASKSLGLEPGSRVIGYKAAEIAARFGGVGEEAVLRDVAVQIGRLAQQRLGQGGDPIPRPAPLYVRPPDAAPPRVAAPPLLP